MKKELQPPLPEGDFLANLVHVDCGSKGPCPVLGKLTSFGAVLHHDRSKWFYSAGSEKWDDLEWRAAFIDFDKWLKDNVVGQPVFVSDNPAYDWQWINYHFHLHLGRNPFGHSGRRIGDFYAGLRGNFRKTQEWKRLRVTKHDNHSLHDATGNAEALERIFKGER